jgi:hypothetical protein
LAEVSPLLYTVSGGGFATDVHRDYLEASFAGAVLLNEFDGRYQRLWTWLWRYRLSRVKPGSFRIEYEVIDFLQPGPSFALVGGTRELVLGQSVLERKWSGRLYIIQHKHQLLPILRYLWQDVWMGFVNLRDYWARPNLKEIQKMQPI